MLPVLTSTYKCLYGCSTHTLSGESLDMIESHNTNFSFQLLCQSRKTFWFLYVKLDSPTNVRARYTAKDAKALAEQYLDHPITPYLDFRALWDSNIRVTLSDLEQGQKKQWFRGRCILVGDAAHKMTPNLAYGFNTAFEEAASLTNHLAKIIPRLEELHGPSLSVITQAFSGYQKQCFARAKLFHDLTNFYTRFAAWEYSIFRWTSKLMPKLVPDTMMVDQFSRLVKGGLKLDFLDVPDVPPGTVPFDDGL